MEPRKVSKQWLEAYFGLNLRDLKGGYFLQTDGGRATWDYERPKEKRVFLIHQDASKTYWWCPPPGVVDIRPCGRNGYMVLE